MKVKLGEKLKMSKSKDIIVKEVEIEEVIKVNQNVPEFNEMGTEAVKENFEKRYQNREKLIIVAYYQNQPIGYIIGYEEIEGDKQNFYCWLAGTDPNYRKMGALTQLMKYQMEWVKKKEYQNLTIKTRNNRREMLSFLVKNGFYFTKVEEQEKIEDNRIYLIKKLD